MTHLPLLITTIIVCEPSTSSHRYFGARVRFTAGPNNVNVMSAKLGNVEHET